MIHLLNVLSLFVFVVMFTSLFLILLLLGECCFVSFVFVFTSLFLTNTFSLLFGQCCFVLSLVCFVFVVFTSLFLTKTFSLLLGQCCFFVFSTLYLIITSLFLTNTFSLLLGECYFVFGLFCICICINLLVPDKDVLSALWPIVQQLRLCQSQSSTSPPPTVVSEPDLLKNSLNIINIWCSRHCGNLWIKLVDIISVISVSKNHQGQTYQDNLYTFRGPDKWGCLYLAILCTCTRIRRTGLREVPVFDHSLYLFCIWKCILYLQDRIKWSTCLWPHLSVPDRRMLPGCPADTIFRILQDCIWNLI